MQVEELLSQVLTSGHELSEDEMTALFTARGAEFDAVCRAAGEYYRDPSPFNSSASAGVAEAGYT